MVSQTGKDCHREAGPQTLSAHLGRDDPQIVTPGQGSRLGCPGRSQSGIHFLSVRGAPGSVSGTGCPAVGVSPHGIAPEKDARDAWARPRYGEHSRSFSLDQRLLLKSQEASEARGPQAGSPGGLSWLLTSPDVPHPANDCFLL